MIIDKFHGEIQLPKNQTHRMTRQRELILEEIRRAKAHPSADEVYLMVRERLPRISLGTVYRNLEILCDLGEIRKLDLGGDFRRYDWDPKMHYHIRCLECGKVDNAPLAPLKTVEDELHQATVYTIIGHKLVFEGLCPACSQKAASGEIQFPGQGTPDER